jgi:hypothetical protein
MVIMIIIAMLITLIRPPIFRNPSIIIPFILVSVGLACLIIAKISLYKKDICFYFGTGLMTRRYAMLYEADYMILGLGSLLLLALSSALRRI